MLRPLYDKTLQWAAHPKALTILFIVSFVESSIFPIPPDIMLIPMILAARHKAWRIAAVCTVASVLGGLAGYGVGYFFFEEFGKPVLEFYGKAERFGEFQAMYNEWGAWAVFIAGLTPFPYKVVTILSGLTHLDLIIFTVSSVLARGLRFFFVAWLLWKFGEPIRAFIEKRLGPLFVLFCVLLVGGFVALKFLF
ncbi:MAG: YqaA family protein [Magnetovibrionaceae bacterium]